MTRDAVKMFCFPYSGGSASAYSNIKSGLLPDIEILPIEIPGRGKRIAERPCLNMERLIDLVFNDVVLHVHNEPSHRYALFGHSLGSLIAFEIANLLRDHSLPDPVVLFVSGSEAPSERDDSEFSVPKSDPELIEYLRKYDGTSDELLLNDEFMSLILPILRADFLLCGSYIYRHRRPLSCPIVALNGSDDDLLICKVLKWSNETTSRFESRIFSGGHFYIKSRSVELAEEIKRQVLTSYK